MSSLSAQQQHELALSAAYEDDTPTPLGWRRKLIPQIGKGLVPARTDIIFIAPSGEEFKTKAQLQRYLRSKKGSPSLSEFIWITDETPRRSSRSVSKCSKSPPKSASKRKPDARTPLEESKAIKCRHAGNDDVQGDKKKHHKEAPVESIGGIEISPTWSSAKDSKKKSLKVTKEKKNSKGGTQSAEVSTKAHMSENNSELQESEKHQDEKREGTMKEEAMEEPISHETMKEEGGKIENVAVEEQEAMEKLISHETTKEESRKTADIPIEVKDLDNGHDDARMDDQEGSKDGTTLSFLGSDFSTDGMEAESDIFESDKKESPLEEEEASNQAEKDQSENIEDYSKKDTIMCPENQLIEADK